MSKDSNGKDSTTSKAKEETSGRLAQGGFSPEWITRSRVDLPPNDAPLPPNSVFDALAGLKPDDNHTEPVAESAANQGTPNQTSGDTDS